MKKKHFNLLSFLVGILFTFSAYATNITGNFSLPPVYLEWNDIVTKYQVALNIVDDTKVHMIVNYKEASLPTVESIYIEGVKENNKLSFTIEKGPMAEKYYNPKFEIEIQSIHNGDVFIRNEVKSGVVSFQCNSVAWGCPVYNLTAWYQIGKF